MKLLTKITLGAFALPAMQVVAQTTKPNIILIMTDQQSYNAISAHADMYGGSYFSTPNIDRLAKEGISFTRTYCANPVSVPSRFALFTGMFRQIRFMGLGVQVDVYAGRMTESQLGFFCLAGVLATLCAAYLLTALAKRSPANRKIKW